uniref:Transmembrane protein n=1 Tax=Gongylonema pulchrum TaxID=637853 RepID=A0A183E1P8_9BILA
LEGSYDIMENRKLRRRQSEANAPIEIGNFLQGNLQVLHRNPDTDFLSDLDGNLLKQLRPRLVDSINQQGMVFFLLGNILTGLINMIIRTTAVKNDYLATAIIATYLFICSIVASVLTMWLEKRRQSKHFLVQICPETT